MHGWEGEQEGGRGRQMVGWTDRFVDGCTDGRVDGYLDSQIHGESPP